MKHDCLTCKFASWTMTKHNPPKINKLYAGTCNYHLKDKQIDSCLPACVLHDSERISDKMKKRRDRKDNRIHPEVPLTCSFKEEIERPLKRFIIRWTENHFIEVKGESMEEVFDLWENGHIDLHPNAISAKPKPSIEEKK